MTPHDTEAPAYSRPGTAPEDYADARCDAIDYQTHNVYRWFVRLNPALTEQRVRDALAALLPARPEPAPQLSVITVGGAKP